MKLARRLIIWLIVGISLVLGGSSWIRYQREVDLFQLDMRRDHRAIASTASRAFESVRGSAGEESARKLVRDLNEERTEPRMSLVATQSDFPGLSKAGRAELEAGRIVHVTATVVEKDGRWVADQKGEERLLTLVPIPSAPAIILELSESLVPARRYLRTTLLNLTLAYLLVSAVCAAIAWGLGVSLVGRPMALLLAKARRVGSGDWSGPLELPQADEVGELAREMNAMCESLSRARTQLETETAARIATAEQLRHADRLTTVGRLAAGIAHELGTPLNVVSGRAKMISRGRASPDQTIQYAEIIAEQAERMASIIRQLLDYARRKEAKKNRSALMPLIEHTITLLQPMARKQGVRLAPDGHADVTASIDIAQFQQALTNLIVNAIHASSSGDTVHVRVKTEDSPSAVVISVVDTGGGMTAEIEAQVFDPFFTTKDVGEGTGLGLSVTREIVEEHGGHIRVESEVGHGTTFTVYLPTSSS